VPGPIGARPVWRHDSVFMLRRSPPDHWPATGREAFGLTPVGG